MREIPAFPGALIGPDLHNTLTHSDVGPSASAMLSLEISRLVARALAGEVLDMPAEGEALAARYPELGMSGDRIGSAIARALAMVGAIRGSAEPAMDQDAAENPEQRLATSPGAGMAEIIVPTDSPIVLQSDPGLPSPPSAELIQAAQDHPAADSGAGAVARFSRTSVAAVRRAFFRE